MSLFGSATRDDFRPDSDVDVLVEFRPGEAPSLFGIVDLREELSQAFGGRRVDVVTPSVFRNPIRAQSIRRDLECIYAAA
jgi:predicted nucleotidyltransferase